MRDVGTPALVCEDRLKNPISTNISIRLSPPRKKLER